MSVLLLILGATISYALYDIFTNRAAGHIDSNLSATIFNFIGAVIPVAAYLYYRTTKASSLLKTSNEGIVYSLLAGFSIAIFSILLVKTFEKTTISYVIPVIYGGSIVISALVGLTLFKDQMSSIGLLGLAVIVLGIGLVIYSKA